MCAVAVPLASVLGGIEAALIFALRIGKDRHVEWPVTLMAVLSAVFLAAGVLCHYWDIYRTRTVRGISFLFVGIDAAGDLTSLVSVLFQPSLDVLGLVIYGTELVLWIGVFLCGGYFNLIPHLKERLNRPNPEETDQGCVDSQPQSHATGAARAIALHNLPSSSSVFRTSSFEGPSPRASYINP